jgi:soluble lytic murein transglycosylase-like protein
MGMPTRAIVRAVAVVGALAVSGSAATFYTVRPGDTLTGIASRFGVSVAAVTSANRLADPNVVDAGQNLVIPDGQAPAASSTPQARPGVLPAGLLGHPSRLSLRPTFRYWARAYGVPAALVEALAWMESGWQTKVVSPTGAIGIGQLEPSTVTFICGQLLHTSLNPHVASQNIRMTTRFLRYLLDQTHGNVAVAVGAYYQGLKSIQRRGPYAETRRYVAVILNLATSFAPG